MADNAKKGKKKGKKGGDDEKKVLFGRPGNHLKMGIVGTPFCRCGICGCGSMQRGLACLVGSHRLGGER